MGHVAFETRGPGIHQAVMSLPYLVGIRRMTRKAPFALTLPEGRRKSSVGAVTLVAETFREDIVDIPLPRLLPEIAVTGIA